MRLIAKKPCSFGGKNFRIGEEIPTELVINPKAQEKLGTLAIVANDKMFEAKPVNATAEIGQVEFGVQIKQKDGFMTLYLNEEQICRAVEVMQMSPSEAKEAIKDITSENILILINACDSRKTIKDATEIAASKLADVEKDGEDEEFEEESEGKE